MPNGRSASKVAAIGAALALLAASASAQTHAPIADYDVTWRAGASPSADVTATLTSQDCTIRSAEKWATFFEGDRGWAGLITRFSARDVDGRRLQASPIPRGWRLGQGGACIVQVSYRVDFAFARRQWEAGHEQVAYVDENGVYSTGLPLFLLGDDTPARVRMHVPAGWRVASPLATEDEFLLEAANHSTLLENTLVVGRAFIRSFDTSGFTVTAALMGDMAEGGDVLADAFSRIVPRYVALAAPSHGGRYMFVVFPGPEDGEAYASSFAVTTRERPTPSNRVIWANHLSHELLHHWIGHMLAPSSAEADSLQWFTEGVTEYYANLTLVQQGVVSDEEYLAILSNRLGAYALTRVNPNFMEVTPAEAGARKWRNRPIVYDGGAAIAFCLDTRIRTLSNNLRSLEDVLRRLLAEQQADRALRYDGIIAASSEAAGADLSAFFARHVRGLDTLPLAQCTREAGFAALMRDYDIYLSRGEPDANSVSARIQRSYLGVSP